MKSLCYADVFYVMCLKELLQFLKKQRSTIHEAFQALKNVTVLKVLYEILKLLKSFEILMVFCKNVKIVQEFN